MCWNIHGYNNIFKLSTQDEQLISKNEIICLTETWTNYEINDNPPFLYDYIRYKQKAIKEASTGRAIGGIIIFSKLPAENVEIIEKEQYWMFLNIKNKIQNFVLGITYFSHSYDYSTLLELFSISLGSITSLFANHSLILCGDYNGRIGELYQIEDEILVNTNFNASRTASDKTANKKGKDLLERKLTGAEWMVTQRHPSQIYLLRTQWEKHN